MRRVKVGILYLCTGRYIAFWPHFYRNFSERFMPDCEKTFFVFTDAASIEYDDRPEVRRFAQEAYDWPYSTLKRFAIFLTREEELAEMDYLFFCNANLECLRIIEAEEVLPRPDRGETLTVVSHQHTWGRRPIFHPYERRPCSRAYIPYNCGVHYVAGGFNGGRAEAFLALCHELNDRTEADLAGGVIAVHHDESQLNRLTAERPGDFRVLPPCYCVPEEHPQEDEVIRILQKKRFVDIGAVKETDKPMSYIQRKWEAFQLNWMPYFWRWWDSLRGKHL